MTERDKKVFKSFYGYDYISIEDKIDYIYNKLKRLKRNNKEKK